MPAPTVLRTRRVGWVAAGVAVAAVAVIVALVAVPALLRDGGGERSVASGSVSDTRDAVTRLRAALVSRDPLTVARVDAELVLLARQLPPAERAAVEAEVVQAHVEAIQFLREHVPTGPGAAQSPPTTVPDAVAPVPTTAPTDDPSRLTTTVARPPPTTTAAPARTVAITAVRPAVDGTFAVEFSVSGFTPERRPGRGSYAVLFSFDNGQEPQLWDGPSPWTFPTDMAIRYQRVCAVVVDADRVEQPRSGNCVAIL